MKMMNIGSVIKLLSVVCLFLATVVHAHSDPATHADHVRLLTELVPTAAATNVAERSGNWSDPTIWKDGLIPVASSRVHVPAGVTVTYDIDSDNALRWVRVDGVLQFSRLVDTKIVVETFLVTDAGRLEIGTKLNPLTRHTIVEFRRVTPELHWSAIELGLIVLGDLSIWGQPVASWQTVFVNPRQGHEALILQQSCNWPVGGTVIIPGVTHPKTSFTSAELASPEPDPFFRQQHEIRQITGVNGNFVSLSAPITHDAHHQVPENVRIAVGYLDRNIVLRSTDATVNNRGHIMVMPTGHEKTYDIGYCSLLNLGRTHVEIHVTDPQEGIPDSFVNPRGRYSLHFHKMGPDNYALVRGVSVVGSLKWGVVNHASVVDVEDCISYDCDGAHFATEAGNEKGSFVRETWVFIVLVLAS
jgi:hypothetical protein